MQCPHCHQDAEFLFQAHDRNREKPGSFDYYRGPCGLVFIGEIPENLGDYYQGGYQRIPVNEAELAAMAHAERHRLAPVREIVKSGRFLEIGPWIGLVSYNAYLAGYDVSVLEQDAGCVDLLRSIGISATCTQDPAEALPRLDGQFDVIALWHSIEHLPRPWEVIDRAAEKLAPGGVLLVAAPNPESAQMRVMGKDWYHLDAPRHIYFPPASMVEDIAGRHGLALVSKTTEDKLGKIIERDGWHDAVHRHIPIRGLRWFYKRLAEAFLKLRHRRKDDFAGAGYTILLRKPSAT